MKIVLLFLLLFSACRGLALDPTDQANLQLWYDADQEAFTDGASITTFTDRSGNAHHGTPNSGTVATLVHAGYNGRKVARTANNTNYFAVASPFTTTNATFTFVTKQTSPATAIYVRASNNGAQISLNRELSDPIHIVRYHSTNGGTLDTRYKELQSSAKMAAYTVVNNAGFVTVYCNGLPMKEYAAPSTVPTAEMQVAKILQAGAPMQADVGEVFIYNEAKSAADVWAMHTGYIQPKYGIAPKAVFFAHGNSLTACMIKDAQYTLRDDFECWDKAWPGQDVQKLADEYQAWAMPRFSAHRPMNVYAAMELHNGLDGTSNQDTYFTEYKTHLLAVKAYAVTQGITVKTLAVTCPASTNAGNAGGADWQSAWAHWNGRVRNEWRDFADGLADIAALPEGDNLTDCANGTYYDPDGIHHTAAFEQLIGAQVFTPALQLLLNPPGPTVTATTLNIGTLTVGGP